MTNPVLFPSTTPRFGLPLLFTGQAQKEVSVNEAHALTDALLFCAIEGTAPTPPTSPTDGTAWLVAAGASGEWAAQDGAIACRQGGNWLFTSPVYGMRVLDRSNDQTRIFLGSWSAPAEPVEPLGGSVVDAGARAAILELVAALRAATILPSS